MVGSVCWRSSAGHHCEWVRVEILGEQQHSEDSNIVVLLPFGDQQHVIQYSTIPVEVFLTSYFDFFCGCYLSF